MKNNTSAALPTSFLTLTWGTSSDVLTSGITAGLLPTLPTTGLILVASFLFVLLLFRSDNLKKSKSVIELPPGPAPWPFLGNLPEIFFNRPAFRWILGLMKDMNTNIACVRLGNVHVVPVTCPEIAREFLKKQDAIFASRPLIMGTEYSSRGYLPIAVTPWGDQWKKMRRVVASEIMSPARLRWLHDKRTEEADNLVRYVYSQCKSSEEGAVVDVREVVRQYSGNVIRKMMFNKRYFGKGREDGGPGMEEVEHVDALFTVLSHVYAFCVSDYMPCLRWLDLNGHEKTMKKAIQIVNKYHDKVIGQRIKDWRIGLEKEPEDLLDVLISVKDCSGKPLLTTEEIKAQTADLIYAAVDNPSNAVEWALAEMLNEPDMLRKAVEEVDRVVGKDRLVQESDFLQLNYVKACAREAFRLHPIAPFNLPHVSSCDATVAGYFIPKGTHVLLSRIGLGRNPKVWDDPLKFRPERHMGSAEVDLLETELRFISFSTGRRGCMGAPLGTAMTVMLLARLLQGFNWSVPAGTSSIDLSESPNDLFLAKALLAQTKPRLAAHLYTPH
ncbi:tryptophan N-monooxygenase CYP79A68-like [Aristolochia californica]|uniref:tryptophan N-monooxygenase CYP79A68-like n=1 Tax=Aristolochia californica TaxID=171875 RepID=UPI0035DA6864